MTFNKLDKLSINQKNIVMVLAIIHIFLLPILVALFFNLVEGPQVPGDCSRIALFSWLMFFLMISVMGVGIGRLFWDEDLLMTQLKRFFITLGVLLVIVFGLGTTIFASYVAKVVIPDYAAPVFITLAALWLYALSVNIKVGRYWVHGRLSEP